MLLPTALCMWLSFTMTIGTEILGQNHKAQCFQINELNEEPGKFEFNFCHARNSARTEQLNITSGMNVETDGCVEVDSSVFHLCERVLFNCNKTVRGILARFTSGDAFATCIAVKHPTPVENVSVVSKLSSKYRPTNSVQILLVSILVGNNSVHSKMLVDCNSSRPDICNDTESKRSFPLHPARAGQVTIEYGVRWLPGAVYTVSVILRNEMGDSQRQSNPVYSNPFLTAPKAFLSLTASINIYFPTFRRLSIRLVIRTSNESTQSCFVFYPQPTNRSGFLRNIYRTFLVQEMHKHPDGVTYEKSYTFEVNPSSGYYLNAYPAIFPCAESCTRRILRSPPIFRDAPHISSNTVNLPRGPMTGEVITHLKFGELTERGYLYYLYHKIQTNGVTASQRLTISCRGLIADSSCRSSRNLCRKTATDESGLSHSPVFRFPIYYKCRVKLIHGEIYKLKSLLKTGKIEKPVYEGIYYNISQSILNLENVNISYIRREFGPANEVFDNYRLRLDTLKKSIRTHVSVKCIPLSAITCFPENSRLIPVSGREMSVYKPSYKFRVFGGGEFQLTVRLGSMLDDRIYLSDETWNISITSPIVAPLQVNATQYNNTAIEVCIQLSNSSMHSHLSISLYQNSSENLQLKGTTVALIDKLKVEECANRCTDLTEVEDAVYSEKTLSDVFSLSEMFETTLMTRENTKLISTSTDSLPPKPSTRISTSLLPETREKIAGSSTSKRYWIFVAGMAVGVVLLISIASGCYMRIVEKDKEPLEAFRIHNLQMITADTKPTQAVPSAYDGHHKESNNLRNPSKSSMYPRTQQRNFSTNLQQQESKRRSNFAPYRTTSQQLPSANHWKPTTNRQQARNSNYYETVL